MSVSYTDSVLNVKMFFQEIQTCNEAFEMADKESRIKFMDEDDSTTTSEDEDESTSNYQQFLHDIRN